MTSVVHKNDIPEYIFTNLCVWNRVSVIHDVIVILMSVTWIVLQQLEFVMLHLLSFSGPAVLAEVLVLHTAYGKNDGDSNISCKLYKSGRLDNLHYTKINVSLDVFQTLLFDTIQNKNGK